MCVAIYTVVFWNSTQKSVIQKILLNFETKIHITEILQILRTKLVLTDNNVQIIKIEQTDNTKSVKLRQLLQNKDHAWDAFLDALIAANQSYLADLLKASLQLEYSLDAAIGKRRVEGQTVLDPLYQALQQQLRQNIIKDCEIIRQAWERLLASDKLSFGISKVANNRNKWMQNERNFNLILTIISNGSQSTYISNRGRSRNR